VNKHGVTLPRWLCVLPEIVIEGESMAALPTSTPHRVLAGEELAQASALLAALAPAQPAAYQLDTARALAVIAAFNADRLAGHRFLIDKAHTSTRRIMGEIVRLEYWEHDGIFARVSWRRAAYPAMIDGGLRAFSPHYTASRATGRPLKLNHPICGGLVNASALGECMTVPRRRAR